MQLPVTFVKDLAVPDHLLMAVMAGVKEVLKIAGLFPISQFKVIGLDSAEALKYNEAIETAFKVETTNLALDSHCLLLGCANHSTQASNPQIEVIVLDVPIYSPGDTCDLLHGVGAEAFGLVFSTYYFNHCVDQVSVVRDELAKTIAMHEFAHVLGVPKNIRPNLLDIGGKHCVNQCVMRQMTGDVTVETLTIDRLQVGDFCPECIKDLKNFHIA